MSTVADLLSEIEAFCKEAEIAEPTFGSRAVNDGKFVKRLKGGAGITIATVDRVRAYITEEREAMRARRSAPTPAPTPARSEAA